ncbi:MAG: aldolase catalytic domain-containing protein [Spirochaetaceae bacterium]|jgi:4-hydroxy 2-oxovalerate aldolase|nr:aldolase catalytic domain-containing protein [Spirochaetaceae bacterium]
MMQNIKILDCTLRDGGYINGFEFGCSTIKSIITKLTQASVEIIECGFLVSGSKNSDKTLFSGIEEIKKYIDPKKRHIMYVAMIQYGAISNEEIVMYDGTSIDGIRITFHEHEIEGACLIGKQLMKKGYKVFMQPVGTNTYTDISLLALIEKVNAMKPYAFYLVDTLGSMYKKDLLRIFYLIDHNLDKNIIIGFHSHNNLQLSFSNAQEIISLDSKREIVLDASVFGMGRGAGNLCTELLMHYINENIFQKYDTAPILEILDLYISPIYVKYHWGYSVPYYIASINNCHPNYASYLINKQTIPIKDINLIISLIDKNKRSLYDENYIMNLYMAHQKHNFDDSKVLNKIKTLFSNKEILILAPGKSMVNENNSILNFINEKHPLVISVNFLPEMIKTDYVFISNLRRFMGISELYATNNIKFICTSNITTDSRDNFFIINYNDYLCTDSLISDNAGVMLLNLLNKIEITSVSLAGFDGFDLDGRNNYFNEKLIYNIDNERLLGMHLSLSKHLHKMSRSMHITFITKSMFQEK